MKVTKIGIRKAFRMEVSADNVFFWANWIGVVALGIGVICACAIAISGKIRDDRLKIELSASIERTATAELKLEQLRKQAAPRFVGSEFSNALKGQPKSHIKISYVRDAPDGYSFAFFIEMALRDAGWDVEIPEPIRTNETSSKDRTVMDSLPSSMSVRGNPTGVTIVCGPWFKFPQIDKLKESATSVGALMRAFIASMPWGVVVTGDPDLPDNTIRIVVAPRP
jgi:hypothetical protein